MDIVGNRDPDLSPARKCWLFDGTTSICGVWGPGTNVNISANWEKPFTGMTPGQVKQGIGGFLQSLTGNTLVSAQNTRQTWVNNEPTSITLEMQFYALEDPSIEVMGPLYHLEHFIAPDVGSFVLSIGEIAKNLTLNIGRKTMYNYLVLNSVSIPYDTEVNSNGDFVRATVTLELSTLTMVTKEMLDNGIGFRTSAYSLKMYGIPDIK